MIVRKIVFELVNPIAHPEYYTGDQPCTRPMSVPDEHWTMVERAGADVENQYQGLLELISRGELVRNPRLYETETSEPVWREVTP